MLMTQPPCVQEDLNVVLLVYDRLSVLLAAGGFVSTRMRLVAPKKVRRDPLFLRGKKRGHRNSPGHTSLSFFKG